MKTICAVLFSFFFLSTAFAFPPPTLCGSYCTPTMQEIADRFAAADAPRLEEVPFVSSGECFHLSNMHDPNRTHYGYTLIDEKDGAHYMGGAFRFFSPSNPYLDLDVERARDGNPRLYEPNHRLVWENGYAFANMNPSASEPAAMVLYWLKQDASNVLLFGLWGRNHRVYCRFSKH